MYSNTLPVKTPFALGVSLITKSNVTDTEILLKEEKDTNKVARNIPLTTISKFLLSKYDYKLPLIANQKQNKYIKDVFEELEYTHKIQKVTTKGKENSEQKGHGIREET